MNKGLNNTLLGILFISTFVFCSRIKDGSLFTERQEQMPNRHELIILLVKTRRSGCQVVKLSIDRFSKTAGTSLDDRQF